MYKKISHCRICKNPKLLQVVNLNNQVLTGIFPKTKSEEISSGPLSLVKCSGEDSCGLVQMEYSFSLTEMYGENYGYRSGLNKSMVEHLQSKVKKIESIISLFDNDTVVDIGSNDATTLKAYKNQNLNLIGVDPTGFKFKQYYTPNIALLSDFFTKDIFYKNFPNIKAKIVTSFSMFYDLENPLEFMYDIYSILEDDGIWVFEQSYMPKMIETNSFDTICHEHLEFYSLSQIKFMTDKVGFKIIDVEFNDINGGSFSVIVSKNGKQSDKVNEIINDEIDKNYHLDKPYIEFNKRINSLRTKFIDFLTTLKNDGKKIAGIGASTKGNVLLQYYNLNSNDIEVIGEVNSDKFNCYTPGSLIPIASEEYVLKNNYDYLLILPWHFRNFFINNKNFRGTKLVFPLPNFEIIDEL